MPRKKRTNRSKPIAAKPDAKLDHLVVIRESAQYDRLLMEGMIHQSLEKVAHLPGATELQEAGLDVLDNPGTYGAVTRRAGKSRITMVERDGVIYFYSMGSAAKLDLDEENGFVSELVRALYAYRPPELWVVAFTRLVRAAELAGDLLKATGEVVEILHCEQEIRPATPEGRMVFQVLAMIAAMEREYIVRRHTAGRVAQWRRGEWIPSVAHPVGYHLVDGRRLALDESKVDAVRKMLVHLADGSSSTSTLVAELDALGITTPRIEQLHGAGATIAAARNPSEALRTILGWASVYGTGRYELLWPNPFPGVGSIAGVPVEDPPGDLDRHEYPHGVLRLPYELDVPPGGWGSDEVLEAVQRRAERVGAAFTGGATHDEAPPLSGLFRYTEGAWEYALIARRGTCYELRRRSVDRARTHAGWVSENGQDAERVAVIERNELHRSITRAVITAVRAGLPATLDAGRYKSFADLPALDPKRARIRALRHQAAQALEKSHRAKRNASMAENPDVAAGFVEDADRAHFEHQRLGRELSELETTVADPELGDCFESSATMVAAALACLYNASDSGPRDLTEALRTVISGERFAVCDEGLAWSLFIELPHEEGTVRLGPITGQVAIRPSRQRKAPGELTRRERASRVRALTDAGLCEPAAHAALRCPHPALAAVLQSHLGGGDLPADVDEAWAHHVIGVYTAPGFRWERGKWAHTYPMRQVVLDAVMANGGSATPEQLAAHGLNTEQVRYLTRHLDTPAGDPILTSQGRGRSRRYSVLRCPHCGGHASLSCVTPETRPGVLCPTCRRTPTPDSPVFPEWYDSPV